MSTQTERNSRDDNKLNDSALKLEDIFMLHVSVPALVVLMVRIDPSEHSEKWHDKVCICHDNLNEIGNRLNRCE